MILPMLMLCISIASAQGERIFLFPEFGEASIYMKNRFVTKSPMNYDANNGKVYFMQGDEMMELTNLMQIDSIRFDDRLFVVKNSDIVETHPTPAGPIQIKWRINKIHEGYAGALGSTSQVPSKKIQLNGNFGMGNFSGNGGGGMYNGSFGVNDDSEGGRNNDIWRIKNKNTYYFAKDGKEYAVSKVSQLYKAFPKQKDQIKDYAKEHDLDFSTAEKAVALIAYAMSL